MEDAQSPKFGNWDSNAKVGGEGKSDNSNHADENPDATSKDEAPADPLPSRSGSDTEVPMLKDESQTGSGDGDQTTSGDTQEKMHKTDRVANRSAEYSPLHPQYQVKSAGKGGSSSPWERKGLAEGSHGIFPSTPGKSKLRVIGRGDETAEKSSAVPTFGEWDKDPSSADGYSDIFNKVREEKQGGAAKVPIYSNDSKFHYGDKQQKSTICCWCFSWAKK